MYFKNLDGFRTLACFAVIFQHSMKGLGSFFPYPFSMIVIKLTEYGELAVQFFFALSGFLITYLILVEQNKNGAFNLTRFYMRRVLRIWPLFFLVLFFAILVVPYFGANGVREIWMYPTFLSNFARIYFSSDGNAMSGITWSVSIEEQFYLFWPLIFFFNKKGTLWCIMVLIIVGILFKIVNTNNHYVYYFHTLSNVLFLATGGLAAYLSFYSSSFLERIRGVKYNLYIYIGIAFLLLNSSNLYQINKVLHDIIFSISFVYIIISQVFCKTFFYEMSNFKRISFVGKYTYGMYLLHPLVIFLVNKLFFPQNIFYHALITIFIFAITLVISMISYNYYELYFLRMKKYFS